MTPGSVQDMYIHNLVEYIPVVDLQACIYTCLILAMYIHVLDKTEPPTLSQRRGFLGS